jgi:hypothetical protein
MWERNPCIASHSAPTHRLSGPHDRCGRTCGPGMLHWQIGWPCHRHLPPLTCSPDRLSGSRVSCLPPLLSGHRHYRPAALEACRRIRPTRATGGDSTERSSASTLDFLPIGPLLLLLWSPVTRVSSCSTVIHPSSIQTSYYWIVDCLKAPSLCHLT